MDRRSERATVLVASVIAVASQHEVEDLLVAAIAQAVYPDGTAAASATGTPARIYRGWPLPSPLDDDLKNGMVNISVFPLDQERNVTRHPQDWQELPQPPVHLTLTVSGNTVTVGGRVTCPLNAAILIDGKAFVYPLQATDTPTSVATGLATLIGSATNNGPVVTIPGGGRIEARTGTVGNIVRDVRRQAKGFRISLWCPTPAIRDATAEVVDAALAPLTFLNLPDGAAGRIRYERTQSLDGLQKARCYRRDFVYSVEFSTTQVTTAAAVISATAAINQ